VIWLAVIPTRVPVDPDAPEAQRWLLDELAKSTYRAAQPSPFQQLAQQIIDWINSLINSLGSTQIPGAGTLLNLLIGLVVLVLLVIAFLIFGLPRLNRRSTIGGELFGEDDLRDAAALRRDAARAAAAGDYTTAIMELFRALARGLDERTLVTAYPGSTARDIAERAGAVFADAAPRLLEAARAFDAVRYLDVAGTSSQWEALLALDTELRRARPTQHDDDHPAEQLVSSPS
jgi:hypothetical protein